MFKYGFGNVYICKITKSDCWNLHLQGLTKEGSSKEVMTSFRVKDEQKKTFGNLHILVNLICFSCLKRNDYSVTFMKNNICTNLRLKKNPNFLFFKGLYLNLEKFSGLKAAVFNFSVIYFDFCLWSRAAEYSVIFQKTFNKWDFIFIMVFGIFKT